MKSSSMTASKSLATTVPRDLVSGLIVFLVALPLCLGIALASGAPLFSGLIAGIVGGIVIGLLSDSAWEGLADTISRRNVSHTAQQILSQSTIIRQLVDEQKVAIVGAVFNAHDGRVESFETAKPVLHTA